MSVKKSIIVTLLQDTIPIELLNLLINEYLDIKTHFALGKYRPDELSGGRFAEILLRIIESLSSPTKVYTPIGTQLDRTKLVNQLKNNGSLPYSVRFQILPLVEVLLDIRNKRDVAHIGVEINPNFSDSRLVCQLADWSLTELIRIYNDKEVSEAQKIVDQINQIRVPIIGEYSGFKKVLDPKLSAAEKTLVILYQTQPTPQKDLDLCKWVSYQNTTRYKATILRELDSKALIHYDISGDCYLTAVGIRHVEINIKLEILI